MSNMQEKYNAVFAVRLRKLMNERKININSVAKAVGITHQAITQYANGETQPNAEKIVKLAKHFDVSSDYLLGLSDVPSQDESVKSIHEKTGLSEDAIAVLTDSRQNADSAAGNIVNHLLTAENFVKLAYNLYERDQSSSRKMTIGSKLSPLSMRELYSYLANVEVEKIFGQTIFEKWSDYTYIALQNACLSEVMNELDKDEQEEYRKAVQNSEPVSIAGIPYNVAKKAYEQGLVQSDLLSMRERNIKPEAIIEAINKNKIKEFLKESIDEKQCPQIDKKEE